MSLTNKQALTEYNREYRKRNPAEIRRTWMKYRWGITPEIYDEIFKHQDGKCAICRRPPGKVRLHIDHKHGENKIRGLLCAACNRVLGMLEGNYDRVISYLAESLPEQTAALTARSHITPRR